MSDGLLGVLLITVIGLWCEYPIWGPMLRRRRMLIFKPKTKRYRISVDIEANGTVTLEKEFPLKLGQFDAVQAWATIFDELSRLHEETGIKFEPRQETLKVEEWVDDNR